MVQDTEGIEYEEPDEADDLPEVEPREDDEVYEAREQLGVGEGIDPLSALLNAGDKEEIRDSFTIKRLKTEFTVKAITDDREYDDLVERCTQYRKRRGGGRQKEIDGRRLSRLVVASYTVTPAFARHNDPETFDRLAERFKTEDPETLVSRALLPGEIDGLADFILTISGFEDEVAAAGN